MELAIQNLLRERPNLKAKKIASILGLERKKVNSFLHANSSSFIQNEDYEWSLSNKVLKVLFPVPARNWLTASGFEEVIKQYNGLWDEETTTIEMTFLGGSFLLHSLGKLLALINQLRYAGKSVSLDFCACDKSFSYLCRVGFFELIDKGVVVTPNIKDATCHYGHNTKVMEFGVITPEEPDENIPVQLKQAFIEQAGKTHSNAAFTMISELFGNVRDHSKSPIDGFAALQVYERTKTIQTVISDSGIGIVGSLRQVLKKRYPKLFKEFSDISDESDALLIKRVFEEGRISSAENNDDESRGLGLKRSGDIAAKFNARIHIRQESFELTLIYSQGKLSHHEVSYGLQKLCGTHICFDFSLE
ncbi:ATP-binding protein [Vibrio cincinnatiensis]|uniref:ATP-binding protein n=1 Tax=Vibrio cincinnatiensis TaxID=675 RepID=UPI001EDDFBDF|nr:ATP-binding protein [Vibrio cincinnatiensis]MCG3766892.1 ATP-binding protein [Vibrio cincinnatiensis]